MRKIILIVSALIFVGTMSLFLKGEQKSENSSILCLQNADALADTETTTGTGPGAFGICGAPTESGYSCQNTGWACWNENEHDCAEIVCIDHGLVHPI